MNPTWHRLDPRMLLVHCGWLVAPLAATALTALATGGRLDLRAWLTLGSIAVVFLGITGYGLLHWATTGYRVGDDAFQVRSGVLHRRLRTVPLSRVRTVDLTANPVHRLLGITILRAGTANASGERSELVLAALSVPAATQLRQQLLHRASADSAAEPTLSTMDMRWLRYAPLTLWSIGGVFVVAGGAYRVLHEIGIEPWRIGFVRTAFTAFGASALWLTIPLLLLAITLLGAVGATLLYLENWWHYRLDRTDPTTLRVQRGLLTTRSVAMETQKLRGIQLREPLLLRAGGGATVRAVTSGLGNREENQRRSALLPPAPRAEALRVVAGVTPDTGLDRPLLRAHPRIALRRRVMRGLLFVVAPTTLALLVAGLLFGPVLLHCAWICFLLGTLATVLLATDAYHGLGHGIHGRYLLARSGTFSRDTVALRRDGILAWTFTESPFARRAGVVTVTAAVAAGDHGYRMPDLAATEAVEFAELAAPGILTEFLAPER